MGFGDFQDKRFKGLGFTGVVMIAASFWGIL